jgi:hypothetical protein
MKPTHLPRILLLALLVGASNLLHAQPHWAYTLGGVGNDHVADIKTDGTGNLYITGEFSGAITFGGQGFQASGGLDLFVAKLDPNGGLIWFRKGGGYGIDRGVKLALDGAGAVAVVGEFMGTADVLGTTLQSAGNTADMFIAKLEASTGNTIWVRQGGGAAGSDRPYAVTFTPNGRFALVANEGEPNADYSVDPEGSVSALRLRARWCEMRLCCCWTRRRQRSIPRAKPPCAAPSTAPSTPRC